MPQLGETVTEGTITRWLKQVGDRVEADEPLFEVSTDKVDSEVPAPVGGVITEILVPEGETVEVGTRLAVLGDELSAPPEVAPDVPHALPETPVPAPPEVAPDVPHAAGTETTAAPVVPAPEPEPVSAPPEVAPEVSDAAGTATAAAPAAPPSDLDRLNPPLTSPIVRRLVAERGLDARSIQGSGPGGRLTRKDVLDAAPVSAPPAAAPDVSDATGTVTAAAPVPERTVTPERPAPLPAGVPGVRDEVIPFDNIRRRTAEHMVRSKATSAHVYTSVEVDFERIERVRRAHQAEWKAQEGFSLTYLPFVARAFCDAVRDFPKVNASVGDNALIVHRDVNLCVAVDLDFEGLVAPVIRGVDGKRLRLISREVHDLAARARTRQLMPDDVVGGTFTVTNPGPFGTFMTLAIINQPQVAILSTDGIKKRPVVITTADGDDTIAIRHTGMLVLTWDHRAFDGGYAAAFLGAMKEVLEQRDWEAELD